MGEDSNQTQEYNHSQPGGSMWRAVSSGELGVSCVLLVVSSLNIGVLVVRRGLRSPNLTARLMGCLAASDFLVNVVDTTLSVLTLGGVSCLHTDYKHSVVIVSIVYNIIHNLSSFLITAICMERSYWLVSSLHGRAHHPPSSAAKFICIFGIAIGLMNIPPWLKLEDSTLGAAVGSGLYVHTSILNWITGLSSLGSLIFLTYLLIRYKSVSRGNISPPVAFQLDVSKSVFLITCTNILPIIVSLALIPFWDMDCVCLDICLPILMSTKSYALVSALRPVILFIRSKKLQRSLLPCVYHPATSGTSHDLAGCTSKVWSSDKMTESAGDGAVAAVSCHRFNTSVVHCDLANHNISISAQTVAAGSMNNLFQAEATPAEPQPAQAKARSSLLSVSWTNNDQNSRVLPLDIRSSTETLHSMASVNLPLFEHRIDVRLHDSLGGTAEESSLCGSSRGMSTSDNQFFRDQPSRLSIQMLHHTAGMNHCACGSEYSPSTHRRAKSPRHGHHQQPHPSHHQHSHCPGHVARSIHLKRGTSMSNRQRALSDVTTKVVSNRGRNLLGGCRELLPSTRSQSLPIICIEQDQQQPGYDEPSQNGLRKASTISSILIPDNQTSPTDSSVASSAVPHVISAAECATVSTDQNGWEIPHLPGSICTPSGIPRARFAFNLKNQHQRRSTTSSDNPLDSPSSPNPVSSTMDRDCATILWPLVQGCSRPTSRLSMIGAQEEQRMRQPESGGQKASLCTADAHNSNKIQLKKINRPKSSLGKKDNDRKMRVAENNRSKLNIGTAQAHADNRMKVCENIRPKSSSPDVYNETKTRVSDDRRTKSSLGIIHVQEDEKMRLPHDRRRKTSLILVNDEEKGETSGQVTGSLETVDVLDEKSGVYIGRLAV